jgi:hypothetical protein
MATLQIELKEVIEIITTYHYVTSYPKIIPQYSRIEGVNQKVGFFLRSAACACIIKEVGFRMAS